MLKVYYSDLLQPVDAYQLQLSEKYIAPYAPLFEKVFFGLRNSLDELWFHGTTGQLDEQKKSFLLAAIEKERKKRLTSIPIYPIGYCYSITRIIYQYLLRMELPDVRSPFHPLKEFIAHGGIFKIIWGEVRHEFFQTALQMGDWCFDVSNDTVYLHKTKVIHYAFSSPECEYYSILSVGQYAKVKANYHCCEVYANTLFPALAPSFPLLLKDKKTGQVSIDNATVLSSLNCEMDELSLPTKEIKEFIFPRIHKVVGKYHSPKWIEYREMHLEEFSSSAVGTNEEQEKEIRRAVNYINFLLRSRSMGR
ncbi:MAG: hypothetical protein ACKOXB_06315 [Flavobacteriales bacterium]